MKSAHIFKQCHCSLGAKTSTLAVRAILSSTVILSSVSVLLIRAYQLTRFLRQPSCRFYPSCSQYTAGSIERFGFVRGALLGSLRILHCHPWHPGGVDEIPSTFQAKFPIRFQGQFPGSKLAIISGAISAKVASVIPTTWGHQARGKR